MAFQVWNERKYCVRICVSGLFLWSFGVYFWFNFPFMVTLSVYFVLVLFLCVFPSPLGFCSIKSSEFSSQPATPIYTGWLSHRSQLQPLPSLALGHVALLSFTPQWRIMCLYAWSSYSFTSLNLLMSSCICPLVFVSCCCLNRFLLWLQSLVVPCHGAKRGKWKYRPSILLVSWTTWKITEVLISNLVCGCIKL